MFNKISQNSFLKKSCKNISAIAIQSTMNETFFRHFEKPEKSLQIEVVEKFRDYQENVREGFGEIGFEIAVRRLKLNFSFLH
jgi:hypothetical protein